MYAYVHRTLLQIQFKLIQYGVMVNQELAYPVTQNSNRNVMSS